MKIDTSDYYPYMPGHGRDDDDGEAPEKLEKLENPDKAMEASAVEAAETTSEPSPELSPELSSELSSENRWERIITGASHLLSWVFVPLLVAFYGTLLIFHVSYLASTPTSTKIVFSLIVFGFTAVVPMAMVLVLKALKVVQDVGLNGRKERLYPYIIMIVSYIGTGIFFHYKQAPDWMVLFYCGGALAALVNLIINFRWKISAHSAGMAGLVAMLLVVARNGMPRMTLDVWLAVVVALTGLLGSARIWLGRHTLLQVLAGYAVGFLSVYLLSYLA